MDVLPTAITDTNLSRAWGRALLALAEPGVDGISPLTVTIVVDPRLPASADADPNRDGHGDLAIGEDPVIRRALDDALVAQRHAPAVTTSAEMIFPRSLWNPALPRDALFTRYDRVRSRVLQDPRNRYGHYFDRMTHFEGAPADGNQLEFILGTYGRGNRRKSALQLSILDPRRDLTDQRQRGFPCLQQVAFTPAGADLEVTAFYATQYHVDRAYGNYLGLCDLGWFVAHELGLRLTRVTCIAARSTLGNLGKVAAAPLVRAVRARLAADPAAPTVDAEAEDAERRESRRIVVARAAASHAAPSGTTGPTGRPA